MSGGKSGGSSGLPGDDPFVGNPIVQFYEDTGTYPSNSDAWWYFKRPIALDADSAPRTYAEVFDSAMRFQLTTGNTEAAKGHWLFDAFKMDRSAVTGIPGLPAQNSGGARPSVCAFYAGRAWYGGTAHSDYSSNLYYSQIIIRDDQVGRCYQRADPTEQDAGILLASDGGVLPIPEMAECIKLLPVGDSLIVFATNGVWRIAGSEGVGFRADDFSVVKVSETPALSPLSFVMVDGLPMWWNRSGIWIMTPSQNGVDFEVKSATDEKIKKFVRDEIPDESKKYVKGAYNHATRIVQWLYRSTTPATLDEKFSYDRILNLQAQTGSYYPWSNSATGTAEWKGIVAIEGEATEQTTENVTTIDKELVYTTDGELVTASVTLRSAADNVFKYLTYIP